MPKDPIVKGIWQHYKGGFYEVLGIASDPTREGDFVVYEAIGITEDLNETFRGADGQGPDVAGAQDALLVFPPELVDGGEYSGG